MLRRKNLLDSGTRDKPGEKGLVMNTVTLNAYPRPSQCPQVFSERGKMRQIGRVRWGWRNTLFEGVCLFYPDMFLHPVHLGVGLLEEAFDFLAKKYFQKSTFNLKLYQYFTTCNCDLKTLVCDPKHSRQ